MIFKLRNLFVLLLALAASAHAVSPPWTPLGPFGGSVFTLTADPARSGTLYATGPQGIFKTVDGGASWSTISLEKPAGGANVAVDPVHPSTLYIRVEGSILIKSTDGGAHWAASRTGLPDPGLQSFSPGRVAVDPANPRRLLLTYLYKAWRSTDAGASWQPVTGLPSGGGASVREIAFAARPAGTAFAATASGLYKSADAGASWRPVGSGLPAEAAGLLALAPSDPRTLYAGFDSGRLFRSMDGGASWRQVAEPADSSLQELAVSPSSPRTIYAGDSNGPLYRSTDAGVHWALLPGVANVRAIAFDPAAPARIYAGVVNQLLAGVFRSDDRGATWTRRSERMTGLPAPLLAIDPEDPDRLWIRVSGLFRSANRGARWARAASPNPTPPSGLAIGASSEVFVKFPFPFGPRGPEFGALWKTADDGASWTKLTPESRNVERFEIAPSELSTIYTVGPEIPHIQRFYRSTDGGATWELRASGGTLEDPASGAPLPFCFLSDLAVAPSAAAVVYISGYSTNSRSSPCERSLIRSGDGGATWTVISAGLPLAPAGALAVDPRNPDVLYVGVGGNGVWKSVDGGQSWAQAGGELIGRTATFLLAAATPDRLYAVVSGRVFRSDDGGASWQGWSRGLRTARIFSLAADPGEPGRIYAATANGVWVLAETD